MIDGSYEITLKSPMGLKRGNLLVTTQAEQMIGTIDILNHVNEFKGQISDNGEFEVIDEIKTSVGQVPYDLKGKICGDEMQALMETSKGIMEVVGKRIKMEME